jgi:alpha-1,2-mannosyltransferase
MIISDCDETYNYWEPLNLLLRGFGKQTWEYSPEYAIRSYAYLIPYYMVGSPFVVFGSLVQFYCIRLVALIGFTIYCELSLYFSVKRNFNRSLANWWLFLSSISPGMAHAGVALLPSSFAMQCIMLACASGFDAFSTGSPASYTGAIFWYVLGGLMGWPFALALGVCFGVYTLAKWNTKVVISCVIAVLSIVAPIVLIDSYFYSKFVFVPLNIVTYNVFGGEGEGPDIFGVEPFSYYLMNLALNFNVVAIIGYVGMIINVVLYNKPLKIFVVTGGPMIIWTLVFFTQPHKEERFLYPIYPLITMNASLVVVKTFSYIPPKINRLLKLFTVAGLFVVSWLRIYNLVQNYSAPLTATSSVSYLHSQSSLNHVNVCTGKEWYHVPTSFFLPDNFRLKYIPSGFDGLLPGDFNEELDTLQKMTSFVPLNMNNKNQFEPDKLIDEFTCDYLIDNNQEPHGQNWVVVRCDKLVNPDGNHGLGRLLYIPKPLRRFVPYNVEYMDFCVYENLARV